MQYEFSKNSGENVYKYVRKPNNVVKVQKKPPVKGSFECALGCSF
jgi:hypothetical protein